MAKITKVFDLDNFIDRGEHDVIIASNLQGIYSRGYYTRNDFWDPDKFEFERSSTEEGYTGDLVITVHHDTEGDFKFTVKNYFTQNGKSKFNYLGGSDYETNGYIDMIADCFITNPAEYDYQSIKTNKYGKVTSYNLTTTVFNDTVDLSGFGTEEEAPEITKGFNIKTGKGFDTITGSYLSDTITGGEGLTDINVKNTQNFGDDVINLTKGEELSVFFETEEKPTAENVTIEKNDIVINDVHGSITFKNLASKNVVGDEGHVWAQGIGEVQAAARYDIELGTKKNKFSSTYLGSDVEAVLDEQEVIINKALTVDLSKSQYANTVDLTYSTGKNTIKGGAAGDVVRGGAGNDTYTLGKGENSIIFDAFGNDTVNLTKDEILTLDFNQTLDEQIKYERSGNDIKVTFYNTELENPSVVDTNAVVGTVTLKNAYTKDVVGENGGLIIDGIGDLREQTYTKTFGANETKYTGSFLNETIDARGAKKGTTISAGGNLGGIIDGDTIYGSAQADKITTGDGKTTIEAGQGNDTITLGKGNKYITISGGDGNDTIKGLSNANLLDIQLEETNNTHFGKSGNDLIISHKTFTWTDENGERHYDGGENAPEDAENITETTTVADFFKGDDNAGKVIYSDDYSENVNLEEAFLSSDEETKKRILFDSNVSTVTGTKYNDKIKAGTKTTKINAGEGNNEIHQARENGKILSITAGLGNDSYLINDFNNTVDITDKGGNDALIFEKQVNFTDGDTIPEEGPIVGKDYLTAVFDVLKDGGTAKKYNDLTKLQFIQIGDGKNEPAIKFVSNLHDFFATDKDGNLVKGNGYIENISSGADTFSYDMDDFNAIRANVAGWLAGTNYNSAYDVMKSNNYDAMGELLTLYQVGA